MKARKVTMRSREAWFQFWDFIGLLVVLGLIVLYAIYKVQRGAGEWLTARSVE